MQVIPSASAEQQRKQRTSAGGLSASGGDIFITLNCRGTIAQVCGASWDVFEAGEEDLRGLKLTDLVAARSHGALLQAMSDAIRDGRAEAVVDLRRDMGAPHAAVLIHAIRGESFTARIRPLTAQKPAADLAAKATAGQSTDQLANVSHEIRTPLNAVIGFADALRQESFGPLGDRRYRDYAKLIQESGQHVLALVNDLLDLSKAEANKVEVRRTPTDVASLIEGCVSMIRLEAEKAGLGLDVQISPRVGTVRVDAKILRQIILNLVSNALKFTDQGTIILRARVLGGQLVIAVEDTGIGMSDEALKKIGQRFYQARETGVRGARGSGLGLALSQALAKAHGGDLDIRSAEGQGTTVTLTLPLTERDCAPRPTRRYEPIADFARERDQQIA